MVTLDTRLLVVKVWVVDVHLKRNGQGYCLGTPFLYVGRIYLFIEFIQKASVGVRTCYLGEGHLDLWRTPSCTACM
jgi:hypothetical protein